MQLDHWDARFNALDKEIRAFKSAHSVGINTDTHRKMREGKAKVFELQNEMDQYLSYVFSQTNSKRFLLQEDRAILHWSTEIAKKIGEYYQSYLVSIQISFWARVVHLIGMGFSESDPVDITSPNQMQMLSAHLKRVKSARNSLERESLILTQKKEQLTQRYNEVLIAKSNLDTAKLFSEPTFAPKNRKLWTSLALTFKTRKAPAFARSEEDKLRALSQPTA